MTTESKAAVLTARRATQHIRLFKPNDAYECLCILTVLPEPSPVSALCWQIHRRLAVLVPLARVWVHCPRASNGLLPRRSNLVGYLQWDARFLLCQTVMFSSFSGRSFMTFSQKPTTQNLRIDPRRLMSKLLHVFNVRPRINSGMAVRTAFAPQFQHT